jgi:CspA family cold shock protein
MEAPKIGKIKCVKPDYGFIVADDGTGDVFFHKSKIRADLFSELRPGDPVRYRLGQGRKGPAAVDIRRVSVDLTDSSANGTPVA